jgi:hypothetical protein
MDTQLANDVREAVIMNPDSHEQAYYGQVTDCGTTACLAGHAMLLSGYTLRRGRCARCCCAGSSAEFLRPNGSVVDYEFREARQLLGLTSEEADELFWCLNNSEAIDRLEGLIKKYENGRDLLENLDRQR